MLFNNITLIRIIIEVGLFIMKFKKSLSLLTVIIITLALVASAYGIFSSEGKGKYEFKSLHGETVQVYGKGLYKNESVSMAAQARAQDVVTLCIGIPLLIGALYLSRKELLKGKLLLAGMLGYFLYTYASYSFYAMYNPMFLVYVLLMSASFFAFILTMMSFDLENMSSYFSPKLQVKFIGGVLIFVAVAVGLMWLKRIATPLMNGVMPTELEHYTTLIIQALDLGFVVPTAILAGVLLIKRKPFGYLLSSVMIIKESTLLIVIIAMLIGQILAGVQIGLVEIVMFSLFTLMVIYCLVLIMKNIKESNHEVREL
jgi:hypothetical protein